MRGKTAPGQRRLGELAEWGRRRLKADQEAGLVAEALLRAATGFGRERLYSHPETEIPERQARRYRRMVAERSLTGCPVAYMTRSKEFAGLSLLMRRGVFIPRPETEGLAELIAGEFANGPAFPGIAVDTCCGSGALGIAIAHFLGIRTILIDRCAKAVSLARENVRRCHVGRIAKVRRGRYLEPLRDYSNAPRVRLIAANPPYVPTRQLRMLPRDIADFEPLGSLDGGRDGLDSIREIVRQAEIWLMPAGMLAMEIGDDEADAVLKLMRSPVWVKARIERDLAGKKRYAIARKGPGKRPPSAHKSRFRPLAGLGSS